MKPEVDIDHCIRLIKYDRRNPLLEERAGRTLQVIASCMKEQCIVCQGFSHGLGVKPIQCPTFVRFIDQLKVEGKSAQAEYLRSDFANTLIKMRAEAQFAKEEQALKDKAEVNASRKKFFLKNRHKFQQADKELEKVYSSYFDEGYLDDEEPEHFDQEEEVYHSKGRQVGDVHSLSESFTDMRMGDKTTKKIEKPNFQNNNSLAQSHTTSMNNLARRPSATEEQLQSFDLLYQQAKSINLAQFSGEFDQNQAMSKYIQMVAYENPSRDTQYKQTCMIELAMQHVEILNELLKYFPEGKLRPLLDSIANHIILLTSLVSTQELINECLKIGAITSKLTQFARQQKLDLIAAMNEFTFKPRLAIFQ